MPSREIWAWLLDPEGDLREALPMAIDIMPEILGLEPKRREPPATAKGGEHECPMPSREIWAWLLDPEGDLRGDLRKALPMAIDIMQEILGPEPKKREPPATAEGGEFASRGTAPALFCTAWGCQACTAWGFQACRAWGCQACTACGCQVSTTWGCQACTA
ncbi:UNVERIFIED_CONTAM: hypothetical protein FKN15_022464 [Acipenser sinensis]